MKLFFRHAYVYDACEITYGSHFDGGEGTDTLYLPMSQAEAAGLGVTITGFEFVEMLPTTKQGQSLCSGE